MHSGLTFKKVWPQDHDNDDSDIANEAEDCVNICWRADLSHGKFVQSTISGHMP